MKIRTKFLCLAMSLCLCVSLMPAAMAAGGSYDGKTIILYTANIRGDINWYPKIAAAKEYYISQDADVILVDAGNFLQGTQYSSYHSGELIVPLLSTVGYSAVALGTHDFDFGNGDIGSPYHQSDYLAYPSIGDLFGSTTAVKAVAANISGTNGTLSNYTANTTVTTVGGKTIGIFGLTDTDIVNRVNEGNLSGLTFSNASSAASAQVTALSNCDITICLSNAGIGSSGATITINVDPEGSFTCGAYVIDENNSVTWESVSLTGSDSSVASAVSTIQSTVEVDTNSIGVASSTVTLDGLNAHNRAGETNTGDLVADAMKWYAQSGTLGNTIRSRVGDNNHIVALYNGGNLRSFLNPGDITYYDLRRVMPYPNTVSIIYMTGAELEEQLEACCQGLPYSSSTASACAAFMQTSGINYTVNTSKTYDAGTLYRSPWYKAASIRRVTINSINDTAFNPTDIYAVVTHDKNYSGMDASYVFKGVATNDGSVTSGNTVLDTQLASWSAMTSYNCYQAVMDYIQAQFNGTIPSTYTGTGSRISIIT
ncbi:MAG: hypothetical protein GX488_02410 [Clostridiales bacterium]|nr:hypothetical protein [Clostridiales bacterium]